MCTPSAGRGLGKTDLEQLTTSYLLNMAALRNATLAAGKFAWQMLWTGGGEDAIGSTCVGALSTHTAHPSHPLNAVRADHVTCCQHVKRPDVLRLPPYTLMHWPPDSDPGLAGAQRPLSSRRRVAQICASCAVPPRLRRREQ